MNTTHGLDRRTLIAGGTLLTAALTTPAAGAVPLKDFSFEEGRWTVRHRKLRKRLAGSNDWYAFGGTSESGSLMDGLACFEDNFLDDPTGAYRATALRRVDPKTGFWSIWWWDARFAAIDPPVVGKFENGVGTFFGDSVLEGKSIKVRFIWDTAAPGMPRWNQAFSADNGATWETNWYMEFRR
jgi:hypothetical protein